MAKEKRPSSEFEGRDEFFMDVDRMINEGLGGGTVNDTHAGIIEEARSLEKEEPPHHEKEEN
ncbi:hypothetical protein [Halalkalibacterium halodurans]|uniref:hypothetical protein n=1 Tax=Halalkalibacterium halodurans TaxID=86665 RepID=UPI002E1BFD79|nr:hypothetical protein [Halalkalibacterium halodurans]